MRGLLIFTVALVVANYFVGPGWLSGALAGLALASLT